MAPAAPWRLCRLSLCIISQSGPGAASGIWVPGVKGAPSAEFWPGPDCLAAVRVPIPGVPTSRESAAVFIPVFRELLLPDSAVASPWSRREARAERCPLHLASGDVLAREPLLSIFPVLSCSQRRSLNVTNTLRRSV